VPLHTKFFTIKKMHSTPIFLLLKKGIATPQKIWCAAAQFIIGDSTVPMHTKFFTIKKIAKILVCSGPVHNRG
jgi:hypothetical protein